MAIVAASDNLESASDENNKDGGNEDGGNDKENENNKKTSVKDPLEEPLTGRVPQIFKIPIITKDENNPENPGLLNQN